MGCFLFCSLDEVNEGNKKGLRILHIISLSQVGGVEKRFVSFWNTINSLGLNEGQFVMNAQSHFHKDLGSVNNSFYVYKKFGCISIPKFLRKYALWFFVKFNKIERVVLWNEFGNFTDALSMLKNQTIVHHESGSAFNKREDSLVRKYLKSIDYVVANCDATKKMILHLDQKMSVDIVKTRMRKELECVRQGLDRNRIKNITFGALSSLTPRKGLPVLLHAFRELKEKGCEFNLNLAGTGMMEDELKKMVRLFRLNENVHFLGHVEDVEAYFQDIDVLVSTSLGDAYSNTIIEALAFGVPCVVPDIDGFVEIIKDGENGWVVNTQLAIEGEYSLSSSALSQYCYWAKEKVISDARIMKLDLLVEVLLKIINHSESLIEFKEKALRSSRDLIGFEGYCKNLLMSFKN